CPTHRRPEASRVRRIATNIHRPHEQLSRLLASDLRQDPLQTAAHQEGETMREAPTQRREAMAARRWFDWVMAALSAWVIGWAHTHGKAEATFFTPWHAAFYTGFLAVAGALVGALVHQRARRGTWQQALPPGYNLALLGAVIFGCGGVGDMLWHTFFGIEKD